MRSLSTVGVRLLRERRSRYLLTAAAVTLGVGVLFSVLVSAVSVNRGFDRFTDDFTGRADVVVTPAGGQDGALAASIPADAARLDGVARAVAAVSVGSAVDLGGDDPERLTLQGVDLEQAKAIRRFVLADGRAYAPGAAEVVLPRDEARRLRTAVGRSIDVAVPGGRQQLAVVGILRDTGAGRFDGGRVGYLPLEVAARLSGRGGAVSRVDVDLAAGVDAGRWVDAHREALGPTAVLAEGDSLTAGFRAFLNTVQTAFGVTAALALFVGGFLIYLTFSVAVVERRRLFGMLRAVGASPSQVRRVVLAEAAALALGASALGIVVGWVFALLLVRVFAGASGIETPSLAVPPLLVVAVIAIGVVATLAAALAPARRAAAMEPVEAMRDDGGAATGPSRAWIAGVAMIALAAMLGLAARGGDGGAAAGGDALAVLLLLFGAVLLVPLVLGPAARVLGRATGHLGRGMGPISVMHLVRERSRSAYTLGLVMVVFAAVFGIGAANASMREVLDEVVRRNFGADVTVWSAGVFDPAADPPVGARIEAVPGVKAVTPLRFGQIRYRNHGHEDRSFDVVAVDPASYFLVEGIAWVDGDDAAGEAALARGGNLIVPSMLANALDVRPGGTVDVRTTAGWQPFTIAGTYASIGAGVPVYAGVADADRLGIGRPGGYAVALADGVARAGAADRIEAAVRPVTPVTVETFTDAKSRAEGVLAGYFTIGYGLLVVVALVGVLGLANTLVVSVLQRRREIGVLRSVGALREQVRGLVTVEAATLVLTAFVLSLPLAVVVAHLLIEAFAASFGFTLHDRFPFGILVVVAVLAVVVALAAAFSPARRAARLEVVQALSFD